MASVTITQLAMSFIASKLNTPEIRARKETGTLPRLKWASRVSLTKPSGDKIDLGQRFFFSWTSPNDCKNEGDIIMNFTGFGEIALAPGKLLAASPHTIDVQDGHLVLSPPGPKP